MQIKALGALAVFLTCGAGLCQGPSLKTDGNRNGRFWRTITVEQKEGYVIGYSEAATLGVSLGTGVNYDLYGRLIKEMLPQGITYGEVIASLDKLFDIPENGSIAISDGIHLAAERAYGKPEAEIQEELLQIRARANSVKK